MFLYYQDEGQTPVLLVQQHHQMSCAVDSYTWKIVYKQKIQLTKVTEILSNTNSK